MKIHSIYIGGFGYFHEWKSENLSDKITIFQGTNEAGKTTLLQFLRRIMYGFPSGRQATSINQYPPLFGGVHGGRLLVSSEDGKKLSLERNSGMKNATISLPDGEAAQVTVHDLVGKADELFFRNVFAIGLDELREFKSLQEESIRDRLFSAGAGSTAISITNLRKGLKEDKENLFKPRGSIQKIPDLLGQLGDIRGKIRDRSRDQQEYDSINEELDEKVIEYDKNQLKKREATNQKSYLETLYKAFDDYTNFAECKSELAKLPGPVQFPSEGIAQLEKINDTLENLSLEIVETDKNILAAQQDLGNQNPNYKIINQQQNIKILERGIEKYRSDQNGFKDLQNKKRQLEGELSDLKKEIGVGWTNKKIESFEDTVSITNTVSVMKKNLIDKKQAVSEAKIKLDSAERERDQVIAKIKQINNSIELQTHTNSSEELKELIFNLALLKGKITKCNEQAARVTQLRDKEVYQRQLLKEIAAGKTKPSVIPILIIGIAEIVVLAIGIISNNLIPLLIPFILLLGVVIHYVLSIIKFKQTNLDLGNSHPELYGSHEDYTSLRDQIPLEQQKWESLKSECNKIATACGFKDTPDYELIPEMESNIRTELTKAENFETTLKSKKELENNLRNAESEAENFFKIYTGKVSEEKHEIKNWENWLETKGLDTTLIPEIVPDLLTKIFHISEKIKALEICEREIEKIKSDRNQYEQMVTQIAAQCDIENSQFVDMTVEQLASELELNLKLLNEKMETDRKIHDLQKKLQNLNKDKQENDLKKIQLLQTVDASDENNYREIALIEKRRHDLNEAISRSKTTITTVCGGLDFDNFIQTLKVSNKFEIFSGIQTKGDEINKIETNLKELSERKGELNKSIAQLGMEEDLSILSSKESALSETLQDYSRQWAIHSIAEKILNDAIEIYEYQRQPVIIKEAQEFFKMITDGRYTSIISPLDSKEIIVEQSSGKRKEIRELSQGTAEQLYLSLRFGYIRDFCRNVTSLPVIFDDILVNFDPIRQKNACTAMGKLSETNQILYFTCHPETVRMFEGSVDGVTVINLDGIKR